MSSWSYYNEIDEYAAAWLRNLITAGHIAPGEVDTRSIEDVHPEDLRNFTQCHFFAGVGVWSLALRKAGWPDSRSIWTGSCPCQPFSQAGEGAGFDDERHLWPHFFHLIEQRRPPAIFGEQVASRDAYPWIDLVQDDLEGVEYRVGAVPFPSASVGAPHIRDRLYWMAYTSNQRQHGRRPSQASHGRITTREQLERLCDAGGLADVECQGICGQPGGINSPETEARHRAYLHDPVASSHDVRPGPTNGLWRDADWLLCRDGKWRPVSPGTFPLVNGAPARVGRLRAYGNAINAEQARVFIEAAMSCIP